jgi:hypothetical protein
LSFIFNNFLGSNSKPVIFFRPGPWMQVAAVANCADFSICGSIIGTGVVGGIRGLGVSGLESIENGAGSEVIIARQAAKTQRTICQ